MRRRRECTRRDDGRCRCLAPGAVCASALCGASRDARVYKRRCARTRAPAQQCSWRLLRSPALPALADASPTLDRILQPTNRSSRSSTRASPPQSSRRPASWCGIRSRSSPATARDSARRFSSAPTCRSSRCEVSSCASLQSYMYCTCSVRSALRELTISMFEPFVR